MPKIIAFGHHKNVGKDTIIRFCIDILRFKGVCGKIVRRGFADNVYHICHLLYGWAGFHPLPYYQANPQSKNDVLANGKTVRQLLIEIGTPVMRAYDENVWINSALKTQNYDILFVNDMRFPNEAEAVKNLGGIRLRLVRPGLPEPTDVADTALNGYTEWNDTFVNDGNLELLYKKAEYIVETYLL